MYIGYLCIGIAAQTLFCFRFLLQWILSEHRNRSYVPPSFWILSLLGNTLLTLHGLLQHQFPVALLSTLNGTIAYRNLELAQQKQRTFLSLFLLFFIPAVSVVLSYLFLSYHSHTWIWMRSPWVATLPWYWHLFGTVGMMIFASRFWLQWFFAEKQQQSFCHISFWYLSLIGGLCSLIYFLYLRDLVNILGSSLALIPYARNIILTKKEVFPLVPNSLFCFAGELSGDTLGAHLLASLPPSLHTEGIGGPSMEGQGLHSLLPLKTFQMMGISGVLKHGIRLVYSFYKIRNYILKKGFQVVCLIDFPDFSMKLAKSLKKRGYQGSIIQYVSPSVWAWRPKRVHFLARYYHAVCTIFPFEAHYYASLPIEVFYVGHPVLQQIAQHPYHPIQESRPILALFPGSRTEEIQRNLPLQLAASRGFDYAVYISVAHPSYTSLITSIAQGYSYTLIPFAARYDLMKGASLSFATCGTVTLELALHAVPTVVTYRLTLFHALCARYLLRISLPFYCIVNILKNQSIFPECIHPYITDQQIIDQGKIIEHRSFHNLALELKELLTSNQGISDVIQSLMPMP